MATTVTGRADAASPGAPPTLAADAPPSRSTAARRRSPDGPWIRRHPRLAASLGVVALWVALGTLLSGRWTLELSAADLTGLHYRLNDLRDWVGTARAAGSPVIAVVDAIRVAIDTLVVAIQHLISQPPPGRPVPHLGWLGVVAVAGWLSAWVGTWRTALLTVAGLLLVGLQGLWTQSMDTLALTLAAVALSLVVGIPIGVAAGVNDRVSRLVTPVLDVAQTMPTMVYLAPLSLFFLIGPASATITTVLYAMPPVIRLTAHGIRGADPACVEAAISLGTTGRQRLTHVLLPLSRRTVALGINQTIMAALSMVTIAALIDAPGLGKVVLKSLETLDLGTAFNSGLAIVVLAVVLDRTTTAGADRVERARRRGPWAARARPAGLVAAGVGGLVAVQLSRTYLWAAQFPTDVPVGPAITRAADATSTWASDHLGAVTGAVKQAVTLWLLNPLESLLAASPWFVVAGAVVALAALAAGLRGTLIAAGCLAVLGGTGLWSDAMVTLASTILATVAVMVLGVVVGVWMGRSAAADGLIRPLLDAAQVMPAFVYLVPFVALFDVGRFAAICAAVVFAAPVAIKMVADGVRAVPTATVEAATSAGCTTWQLVTTVQLPMAARSLALALNQGLIYVLSMVVVGAFVGAGALGYDVVAGFSQGELYGKGLAAGAAIVVLGVLLDRLTQAVSRRPGRAARTATTRTATARTATPRTATARPWTTRGRQDAARRASEDSL